MLLVRDIMHCKPGKVRAMVDKFLALADFLEKGGGPRIRVLTDVAGERYWTVVAETQVESLAEFMSMGPEGEDQAEFQEIMKGYHDLVQHGRREIYTIEE